MLRSLGGPPRGKPFLYPWERLYVIVCPKCGGRIETHPLWKKSDDWLKGFQQRFCHVLDREFLEKIPVLTENDRESYQRFLVLETELGNHYIQKNLGEDPSSLFTIESGVLKIFSKHGIFALINFLSKTELGMIFLFLGVEPDQWLSQVWFQVVMEISRSHVSTILKKLLVLRLIQAGKPSSVKGRARGRQLVYQLSDKARKILEEDLKNHSFFRKAVIETIDPIADRFPMFHWRKDLRKQVNRQS